MFAELHSGINSHNSSLLHLTGQPYCKKSRSAKVKDGIITYFLGTISLIDTYSSMIFLIRNIFNFQFPHAAFAFVLIQIKM
jgi:hypothetical protein